MTTGNVLCVQRYVYPSLLKLLMKQWLLKLALCISFYSCIVNYLHLSCAVLMDEFVV